MFPVQSLYPTLDTILSFPVQCTSFSTVQCTSFSTSSVLQYPWPYYICYQFILTVSLHFLQYLYYKSLYPVPTMYCISSTTSPYILYLLCISSTTSPYIQYLQLNSITSSFSCSTCKSACTVKGCVLVY